MSLADSLHLPTDPRKRQLVLFGGAGALLGVAVLVRRRASGSSSSGTPLVSGNTGASTAGADGANTTTDTSGLGTSAWDLTTTNDLLSQLLSTIQSTGTTTTSTTGSGSATGGVVTTGDAGAAQAATPAPASASPTFAPAAAIAPPPAPVAPVIYATKENPGAVYAAAATQAVNAGDSIAKANQVASAAQTAAQEHNAHTAAVRAAGTWTAGF